VSAADKLFQTLVHELCHVAAWLIDHSHQPAVRIAPPSLRPLAQTHERSPQHGGAWLKWMRQANKRDNRIVISARHSYTISHKYTYRCDNADCGTTMGRDSKMSDKLLRERGCARCLVGRWVLQLKPRQQQRAANPFALHVQHRLAAVKKQHPGLSHQEVMRLISDEYKRTKANAAGSD